MRRRILIFGLFLWVPVLVACGTDSIIDEESVPTGSPPIIMRISPDSGTAGETITVFGVGYSIIPSQNILFIGDGASVSMSYALVDNGQPGEVEQLTFMVPEESLPGTYNVVLLVDENTSNADIPFTVLP